MDEKIITIQMRLYLDDIRIPKSDTFTIVRSYKEAVKFVEEFGIPEYISFDHDLEVDSNNNLLPTGYDFAKCLVEMDMNNIHLFPKNFKFNVHSANPIGKVNIESYLTNYLQVKEKYYDA